MKLLKSLPFYKRLNYTTKISFLIFIHPLCAKDEPYFIIGKDGFNTNDQCIGCKKCEKVCPLNNITIVDSKPVWDHNCTHCMACIHQCPTQAIEFKKITLKKNRYYNHGV